MKICVQRGVLLPDYKKLFDTYLTEAIRTFGKLPRREKANKIIEETIYIQDPLWENVKWSKDTLIINKNISDLLDGILMREIFRLYIPQELDHFRFSYDLAMLYAYINLSKKKQQKWLEYWSKKRTIVKNIDGWFYESPHDIISAYSVRRRFFLHDALNFIEYITKVNLRPDVFIEYIGRCNERKRELLTHHELFVLKAVYEEKTASPKKIEEKINLGQSQVSQILSKLKSKGIRIYLRRINILRLGITEYFLAIKRHNDDQSLFNIIVGSPYLFRWMELYKSSEYTDFFFYRAPLDETFYRKMIESLQDLSKKYNLKVLLLKSIDLAFPKFNLDLYLPNHGWSISWTLLHKLFKSLVKNDMVNNQEPIKNRDTAINNNIDFDMIDLKILHELYVEPQISVSRLRKMLKIGQTNLIERINRLREQGIIIEKAFFLDLPGLPEKLFLLLDIADFRKMHKLDSLFGIFPQSIPFHVQRTVIESGDTVNLKSNKSMLIYLNLPFGSLIELFKLVDMYLKDTNALFFYQKSETIFKCGLPIDGWDDTKKTWIMQI